MNIDLFIALLDSTPPRHGFWSLMPCQNEAGCRGIIPFQMKSQIAEMDYSFSVKTLWRSSGGRYHPEQRWIQLDVTACGVLF